MFPHLMQNELHELGTSHRPTIGALINLDEISRLLVKGVTDYAIFALDSQGNILTWNKGAERLKGYTSEEIIGEHFSRFYTEEDLKRKHPEYELNQAMQTGKFEEEGWRLRKDGSQFWASVMINKLNDAEGNFIGFSKVTRDLTERKKSEERLRLSEERFRLLVTNIQDYGILTLDPEGKVVTWNLGAERIEGYLEEEILGEHFSCFYLKDDIQGAKPEMQLKVASTDGRFDDEGWRVRKDGSLFWASVIITAMKDGEGKLRGFAMIIRDLTERKKSEEKLRAFNESLEKKVSERTAELSTIAAHLETAVKARDDFMSIASHELNTPLTTLKLQTQIRRRRILKQGFAAMTPEGLAEMLEDDEKQINRLARLVDDMLDITKIAAGKFTLRVGKVDLEKLVRENVARLGPQLKTAGCDITVSAHGNTEGQWDSSRLEQVFNNLLTNAMKYGAGHPIQVSVAGTDSVAKLIVRDHGVGIAPEDQERVFLQFERATPSSEVTGLGLGLYIARQIVEAHKGSIKLESRFAEGSLFVVELPKV